MASDPKALEEMKTIFFTNLHILGMDIIEKEETYKMSFNIDMFNLPNKAASEVVLYFLFNKLNPSACKEQFRDCWPVLDRKSELHFRKVCTTWLTSIQKSDVESHLPYVNAALLLSPGGRKFIHLLYSFSTYVLVQVMKSCYGWETQNSIFYPVINQRTEALDAVSSAAIENSLKRESNKFFEYGHQTVIANRQWKDYSNALIREYRTLTKASRDLEVEKRQKVNIVADNCLSQDLSLPTKHTTVMFDSDQNIFAARLGQRIERAVSHWTSLTKFGDFMAEKREIFKSILDNTSAKFAIDGTEMGVRVPGLLLRECSKEMQKRGIDNIYNGGALNLVSLVQLWNLCLNMYKEHLKSETLPSVSSEVEHVTEQAHKHHSYLKGTQELREKIRDHTLPNLKRLIARLQKKLNSLGASAIQADKDTNRLGLALTAPTPPTAAVARSSNSVRETPPGPVAGPAVHVENTPDALQNVHSEIEMSLQKEKDAKVSQVSMDGHSLSRLMNIQQGSVRKRGTDVQVSKTQLKKNHMKSVKPPQNRTKGFNAKNNHKPGLRASIQNSATHQNKQIHKILEKPIVSNDCFTTPRTSKQTAVDLLADSVVNSVLNSTNSAMLSDMSIDALFDFGDLGAEAFASRSLIRRSPIKFNKLFQNLENQQASEYKRSTFSVDKSRTDDFHYHTSIYKEKTPDASVYHESVFSQNSKDADSSFGSVGVDFDWSNNAAVDEAGWLSKLNKSRSDKQSSRNNFNGKTEVFCFSESLPEAAADIIKTDDTAQHVDPSVTSAEKMSLTSLRKGLSEGHNIAFSGAFSNDWQYFNRVDALDKPSIVHLESGKEQQSSTQSHTAHSFVSNGLSLVNRNSLDSDIPNNSHNLFLTLTKSPNIYHSPSSLSQNRLAVEKTSYCVSPNTKSVCKRTGGIDCQDMPYRQPGDGQASSVQTVQPVHVVPVGSDSDTETEKTVNKSRLISLSSFKLKNDSFSASDLFTPVYNRLNDIENHEESIDTVSSNLPQTSTDKDSDTKLPLQQESELESYSHGKLFSTEGLSNEQIMQTNPNTSSLRDLSTASDEKLLDLGNNNVPVLVSLDSEDEDLEYEQTLNDSYIPFKHGIHLESRSPIKHNLTPTRAIYQPLVRTSDPVQSSKGDPVQGLSSEDSYQKKLVLLQQRALHILNSSFSEEPSLSEKFSITTTNSKGQKDAAIINANDDKDDILRTELINTELLTGLEDLASL